MKKLFLIAIFAGSMQVGYAQMTGGEKPTKPVGCSEQAISSLSSCMSSKGVNYKMTKDGSGTIYITAQDHTPPGHIQSCIAHYNKLRRTDCPEAPEAVYVKSNKGKKR